ncbi:hypothetical protein PHISP_04312 [Aspergillus sp. HF37]|nr:hypothetical protein PHISP_04312 [Aspergillus sp. HF37]
MATIYHTQVGTPTVAAPPPTSAPPIPAPIPTPPAGPSEGDRNRAWVLKPKVVFAFLGILAFVVSIGVIAFRCKMRYKAMYTAPTVILVGDNVGAVRDGIRAENEARPKSHLRRFINWLKTPFEGKSEKTKKPEKTKKTVGDNRNSQRG